MKTPIEPAVAPRVGRRFIIVFGAWSFLASLLIFWVELMVAKMLLPRFGGSASVWNTALVFFQVNLLVGYAFAHLLAKLNSRHHKWIQAVLVTAPLLTLPIALPAFLDSPGASPTWAVLLALTLMVGAPFFALSTSTPTLQAWFSHSSHPRARDPYFLYALSNVGSVVGLLGYPVVIERYFSVSLQTVLWTVGYAAFAILTLGGARLVGSWKVHARTEERPPLRQRLLWAAIAFVPSLTLLGVTRHLSTDVAAFPLMWTVPLALYLASFVITFRVGGYRWTEWAARALRVLIVPAALIAELTTSALWFSVGLPLVLLTAVSLAAHGRVYQGRPPAGSLTDFYLWVSIGGAAGGLFAALIAPAVFDFVIEYPLGLVLAALLAGPRMRPSSPDRRVTLLAVAGALLAGSVVDDLQAQVLLFGVAGVLAVFWLERRWFAAVVAAMLAASVLSVGSEVLVSERTFFGVYRVHDSGDTRHLMSGTTSHGAQLFEDGVGLTDPLSYYHRDGPVGDIFGSLDRASRDVGIIGLGVGSMMDYARAQDSFTFYEIDPVVEALARDPAYFTLLTDTRAEAAVVIGDGRIELERLGSKHDLLVVDAFTSDAIPVHLLTLEAFDTYFDSLNPGGAVLVHISNRHLDLEPVVGKISQELGVTARIRRYSPAAEIRHSAPSAWMVLERGQRLSLGDDWELARTDSHLWTDDYSNVLAVVEWR